MQKLEVKWLHGATAPKGFSPLAYLCRYLVFFLHSVQLLWSYDEGFCTYSMVGKLQGLQYHAVLAS